MNSALKELITIRRDDEDEWDKNTYIPLAYRASREFEQMEEKIASLEARLEGGGFEDIYVGVLEKENERLKEAQRPLINAALSWRQSWPDETDEHSARDGVNDPVCNLIRACDLYKGLGKPT